MDATVNEIKSFFGYNTLQEFKKDWMELTEEEKKFFRTEVGKEIHKD